MVLRLEMLLTKAKRMMVALIALLSLSSPLLANDQSPLTNTPTGPVVLTISGAIEHTNADQTAEFDMAGLMAMPSTRIHTTTPWTEGVVTFDGVAIKALLNLVGANKGVGEFTALNDYTVRIPLEDTIEHGAIIAYLQNGKRMSVRDKGPLWLIYPLDSDPTLQNPVYRDRMIWQLRSIHVK